jgi:hypothetical protein
LRDFSLVWDWEDRQGLQGQEKYEILTKIYSQALEHLIVEVGDYLYKAIRVWNDIIILDDLGEYEIINERLIEARSSYIAALGQEHLPVPIN